MKTAPLTDSNVFEGLKPSDRQALSLAVRLMADTFCGRPFNNNYSIHSYLFWFRGLGRPITVPSRRWSAPPYCFPV